MGLAVRTMPAHSPHHPSQPEPAGQPRAACGLVVAPAAIRTPDRRPLSVSKDNQPFDKLRAQVEIAAPLAQGPGRDHDPNSPSTSSGPRSRGT